MLEISLRICCCTFCTRRGFAHAHTQRGDRGTRRARLRMACVFLCPARKGAARAGHMEETRRGRHRGAETRRRQRAVSARRNAYTLRRRRGEPRSTCSRPTSSGDVPARADESAMLLATFFGKRTRGEFRAKTADLVNPRQTNYFRETPDADSRAHHFEARARGGGGASFPHGPSRFRGARPPRVSADRRASRKKSPRLRHFRRRNVWS